MRFASPRRLVALPLALPLALALGCSDTGSPGDWLPDDLDEQATLEQIGQTGYQKLCSAFSDYVTDMYSSSYLIEAVCTAIAIENTTNASECGDMVQTCKNNPPAEATAMLAMILAQAGCSAVDVAPTEGCSATVAQVKACLDGLGEEVEGVRLNLTCAAAGQTLDDSWWHVAAPSACSSIESICP